MEAGILFAPAMAEHFVAMEHVFPVRLRALWMNWKQKSRGAYLRFITNISGSWPPLARCFRKLRRDGLTENNIPPQGGFLHWLDHRTGWRGMLHDALDEPIPGGARLAYI